MWFSVVCTLIDNDTRHHSGQNVNILDKWRLNLNDNALYIISFVLCYQPKSFSHKLFFKYRRHLCKVSLRASFVTIARNYLEVKYDSVKSAIWRATFRWLSLVELSMCYSEMKND